MTISTNPRDDNWSGEWIATKIREHDNVKTVSAVHSNLVRVERVKGGAVNVATMSVRDVDAAAVRELLRGSDDIDFVVNISKDAYVDGDVYLLAEAESFGFGGYGDLLGALSSESPRTYVNKEFTFVLNSIRQHTKVANVTRLDDRRLRIDRNYMEPVTVLVLNEYELAAEHVRNAIRRYGKFQAIVRSNPNGRTTSAAFVAAQESGINIFTWAEFFKQLNLQWS
jgi:hypothetical protein